MITMEDKIMRSCIRRQISLDTMLQISGQMRWMSDVMASSYSDYLTGLLAQSKSEHEFCELMQEMIGYYD